MAGMAGFEPTKCQSQSLVPYRLATSQYIKRRAAWTHRGLYHANSHFATIFFAGFGDFIDKKRLKFSKYFAIMPLRDSMQGSYIGNTTASQAVKAGSIPVPCSKKARQAFACLAFLSQGMENRTCPNTMPQWGVVRRIGLRRHLDFIDLKHPAPISFFQATVRTNY